MLPKLKLKKDNISYEKIFELFKKNVITNKNYLSNKKDGSMDICNLPKITIEESSTNTSFATIYNLIKKPKEQYFSVDDYLEITNITKSNFDINYYNGLEKSMSLLKRKILLENKDKIIKLANLYLEPLANTNGKFIKLLRTSKVKKLLSEIFLSDEDKLSCLFENLEKFECFLDVGFTFGELTKCKQENLVLFYNNYEYIKFFINDLKKCKNDNDQDNELYTKIIKSIFTILGNLHDLEKLKIILSNYQVFLFFLKCGITCERVVKVDTANLKILFDNHFNFMKFLYFYTGGECSAINELFEERAMVTKKSLVRSVSYINYLLSLPQKGCFKNKCFDMLVIDNFDKLDNKFLLSTFADNEHRSRSLSVSTRK